MPAAGKANCLLSRDFGTSDILAAVDRNCISPVRDWEEARPAASAGAHAYRTEHLPDVSKESWLQERWRGP